MTLEDWADDDFFAGVAAEMAADDEEEEKERARAIALLKRMEAPLTLWTIPEVASSGLSVEEALARGEKLATAEDPTGTIVYGYGYFKDLARGRLSGDLNGFLKIIARAEGPNRHEIIGVHIVGDGANELIQLGSVLVHSRTTLEELSNTPFAGASVRLGCKCERPLTHHPLHPPAPARHSLSRDAELPLPGRQRRRAVPVSLQQDAQARGEREGPGRRWHVSCGTVGLCDFPHFGSCFCKEGKELDSLGQACVACDRGGVVGFGTSCFIFHSSSL